jgi:copper chaperone NosL
MRFTILSILLVVLAIGFSACNNGPQPISYSQDACDFCRMTIVDKQHAAQIVTEKGRNYKYDAIECMVNDLKDWDRPTADQLLVTDYANPGKLTNAKNAQYLISKNIPSPMGAFLSAFESPIELKKAQEQWGGEAFNWEELKLKFDNNHQH